MGVGPPGWRLGECLRWGRALSTVQESSIPHANCAEDVHIVHGLQQAHSVCHSTFTPSQRQDRKPEPDAFNPMLITCCLRVAGNGVPCNATGCHVRLILALQLTLINAGDHDMVRRRQKMSQTDETIARCMTLERTGPVEMPPLLFSARLPCHKQHQCRS